MKLVRVKPTSLEELKDLPKHFGAITRYDFINGDTAIVVTSVHPDGSTTETFLEDADIDVYLNTAAKANLGILPDKCSKSIKDIANLNLRVADLVPKVQSVLLDNANDTAVVASISSAISALSTAIENIGRGIEEVKGHPIPPVA